MASYYYNLHGHQFFLHSSCNRLIKRKEKKKKHESRGVSNDFLLAENRI